MTKDELVARLHDIEWDDFEVRILAMAYKSSKAGKV